MQLHLEGSNDINSPKQRVYSLLTDPSFISRTLPDAEDVRVLDGASLEAKLKLKVAVVSATMKMKMTVEKTAPPNRASLVAEGTGSGSTMRIRSTFDLSGDAPTTMTWVADAEITGVMAGMGSSLLKGYANKKVAELFSGISKAVEESA